MTEPTTPIKALIIPNTGDLVGAWGTAAVNVDWTAVDGMLGGAQTLSLSSATTFTLSAPAGAITPGAGPNQAQNAILKFTGTLSGNAVITLPLPGYYIVNNQCTVGTNYIQVRAAGTGQLIGIPQGRQTKIWNDGTDAGFCDTAEVGSYLDLAASTTPSWFAGCTTPPWVVCDGSVYNVSTLPALGALLGSTFGGNGITTFGVPDMRNRVRIPIGGGRVTIAGSGVNGAVLGASGGADNQTLTQAQLPAVALSGTVTQNQSVLTGSFTTMTADPGTNDPGVVRNVNSLNVNGFTIQTQNMGSGNSHPILQPTLVAGITLIKS
jgi:microcystin-dependent protein